MTGQSYRIGEAANLLQLKTYVLRFWETEFPQIAPSRTEKGQRVYTEKDLAALYRIRHLLHEQGLTIDGARRILNNEAGKGDDAGTPRQDQDAPRRQKAAVAAVGALQRTLDDIPADEELALPLAREVAAELSALRRLLSDAPARDA